MRRRDFIAGLGSAVAWSLMARAQQSTLPVIGFLHQSTPESFSPVAAFHQGLKEAGFVERQNVVIEYRWGNNQPEQLVEQATDLVRRRVAVIAAFGGSTAAVLAKAATSTIPIVFGFGSDPVKLGLVASLSRPGGNVIGATFSTTELTGKRLSLLRDVAPGAATVAYLSVDTAPSAAIVPQDAELIEDLKSDMAAAARAIGWQLVVAEVRSANDFDAAFATFAERQVDGLIVPPLILFNNNRDRLLALAARHKIPAIYQTRGFAVEGGLMSYGAPVFDTFRQGGVYVGRILRGEKPADLPIVQPTKFELVINLKTAKALGLTIPPGVLAIADEVIE
jgi:putative ABC transport system substrate-binding protein